RVLIANNGSYPDTAHCILTITDSIGTVVYCDTLTTAVTAPDDTATLNFPPLTLSSVGQYRATAIASCTDDFQPGNDTLLRQFSCTYEIIYDDGIWDAFYWVGRRDNDKFYVRFTPTISPPYSIRHCRIATNMANTPFDYVMICPGTGNKPDTLSPLHIEHNVLAPSAPGWAEFDLDITCRDSGDIWAVIHWSNSSPAIGVGADATQPIDLRSYFSSNQDTFQLWTAHDWMVRLTQSPDVGIAAQKTETPLRQLALTASPNPTPGMITFTYSVPQPGRIELQVFDASGRICASPLSGPVGPGRYSLRWLACNSDGKTLSPGIYFARLVLPETGQKVVTKLVLTGQEAVRE
ncbi:MAG: T9SS type A sorting domain-containing protein, partial [candidate division WOR-3 bacterium]